MVIFDQSSNSGFCHGDLAKSYEFYRLGVSESG